MISRQHRLYLSTIVAVAAIAAIAGCAKQMEKAADQAPASEVSGETAPTDKEAQSPLRDGEVPAAGVEDLVRTNNLFAFDLYRTARSEHFVISPHALAGALAMTHAAASGPTAAQIATTLRVSDEEDDLQQRFQRLNDLLRGRAKPATKDHKRGFNLLVSHGVWLGPDVSAQPDFQRVATTHHFATIESHDLGSKSAVAAINTHYTDVTSNKMTGKVLDAPLKGAELVLTHTAQFDAPWTLPFERALSKPTSFAGPDGAMNVQMMSGRMRTGYFDGDGFQLVELPYSDGRVSAWVVLPDEGNEGLDGTIAPDFFDWMISNARQREVAVQLPRFEVVSRHDLKGSLATMGMPAAFEENAEFTGFGGGPKLTTIVQVARLKVDEDGSDALAATRGSITGAGGELPKFVASRPFMVVVRDNPSGAIVMMARIAKP